MIDFFRSYTSEELSRLSCPACHSELSSTKNTSWFCPLQSCDFRVQCDIGDGLYLPYHLVWGGHRIFVSRSREHFEFYDENGRFETTTLNAEVIRKLDKMALLR